MSDQIKKIIYGKKSFEKKGILYVTENNFQSPPFSDESSIIAINAIKKIQNSIFDSTFYPELFAYENFSLWWLMYPQFFSKFQNTIDFVTNFSNFIDQFNPNQVRMDNNFTEINLIKQICQNKNISFTYSKFPFFIFKIKKNLKKFTRNYGSSLLFNRKTKERKKIFFSKKNSIPSLKNKIIFVAGSRYHRKIFDPITGKNQSGEHIIQNLMELIKDKKSIIGVHLWSDIRENNISLKERITSKIEWIPIDTLLKNKNKKEFLINYQNLISSKKFQELIKFNDISLWESLESTFEKMKFAPYLPFWISLIDSLTLLFSKEKPKAIFLPYETGPVALSFIIAAKRNNVKTIGIQHGFIHKFHKSYSHETFASEKNPYGFPLPNNLLLYGKITKKLLEEKNYPSQILIPFGNPIFFNLDLIKKSIEKTDLYTKYGIKSNQKIILYTTSGFQELNKNASKYDFDSQVWRYLLKHFGNRKEIFLLLKPHPLENPYTYKKLLKENNFFNAKVVEDNLLELINLSTVVISIFSTTIFDSMCFKKPVIQVTFKEASYSLPFDQSNVIVQSTIEKLSEKILEIINNQNIQNKIIEDNSNFIQEFYSIPEKDIASKLDQLIKDL